MGFEKKIADILQVINERKKNKNDWNTALVSATLSSEVCLLIFFFLHTYTNEHKRNKQTNKRKINNEKKCKRLSHNNLLYIPCFC